MSSSSRGQQTPGGADREHHPATDVAPYLAANPERANGWAPSCVWAFEKVGFYYRRGHGIPQPLIDTDVRASGPIPCAAHGAQLSVKVNEDNVGYLPMKVGQFPGRRRARTPRSSCAATASRRPLVLASAASMGSTMAGGAAGLPRDRASPTCRRWRRWCRRLVPIYATARDCRRMPSTRPMPSATDLRLKHIRRSPRARPPRSA